MRAEHESLVEYLTETLTAAERRAFGLISFSQWTFTVGAVVETGLAARELGAEVVFGFWADETPLKDTGWRASRTIARLLGSRTRDQNAEKALLAAGFQRKNFARPPIRRWRPTDMPPVPSRLTRSAVRSLTYRGSGMGRSILQVHPDKNTPIRDDYEWPRAYVEAAMRSYAWAFDQAQLLIRERDLSTVAVYNGRFTHDRAVAAAAEQMGVKVLYYDTGGYETDFDLTTASTHDWVDLQRRMGAMFDAWDPQERVAIGRQWFENRQNHADANNSLFTGIQVVGHVDELPESERLVVYFSSSGDEIAELELDWDEYLGSQEQALIALADVCRATPGTRLVVRTHPHMRLKPKADLADWLTAVERASPDAHFGPESSVDSYTLMKRADLVATYGSTSGVEAAFLGRPVIVMGPSAYDLLGCAHRIRRSSQLPAVVVDPPASDAGKALPYGLMMERRGFMNHYLTGRGEQAQLGDVPLKEASDATRKISDLMKRRELQKLTG